MIDLRSRIPSGYTGRFTIPNLDEVEGIAVHHSVSGGDWGWLAHDRTQKEEVNHLLAIDRWHSPPNNNWGGFGYHVAAFASGRVYLAGSLNTARAHVASLNKRFIGLVLIGDFTDAVPLESHLEAAREGVAFIRDFYGRALPLAPHRMIRLQNTTCPGNRWREWMPLLEKEEDMITIEQEMTYKRGLEEELTYINECLAWANELRAFGQELACCTYPRGPGFGDPPPDWKTFRKMKLAYQELKEAAEKGLERCSIYGRAG